MDTEYLSEDKDLVEKMNSGIGSGELSRIEIQALLRSRKTSQKLINSTEKYSKWLVALTWLLVIFTVGLFYLTYTLIKDAKLETSSQNNIALNSRFFDDKNTGIIDAMENNKPILVENKGSFKDTDLSGGFKK